MTAIPLHNRQKMIERSANCFQINPLRVHFEKYCEKRDMCLISTEDVGKLRNSVNNQKGKWKARLTVLDQRQIWLANDKDYKQGWTMMNISKTKLVLIFSRCLSVKFDSHGNDKIIFSKNTDHLSTGILEDCEDLVITGINGMCRSNCKDDNS